MFTIADFMGYFKTYSLYSLHLVILTVMLCLNFQLKEHKVRSILIGIIPIIVSVVFSTFVCAAFQTQNGFSFTLWNQMRSLGYIFCFVGIILGIMKVFKVEWKFAVMNIITAFAIRQFSEMLVAFITVPFSLDYSSLAFQITRYTVLILCSVISYLVIIQRVNKRTLNQRINTTSLVVAIIATLVIIVCSSLQYEYLSESIHLTIICDILQATLSLIVIILKMGAFETNKIYDENDMEKKIWQEKEKQLQYFKYNLDDMNMKYHDLKKLISSLESNPDNVKIDGDFISELKANLGNFETFYHTGNDVLDLLLSQYALICRNNHIRFSCIVDGSCLNHLSSTDLTVWVSNILDNSIEAVMNIVESSRSISFNVSVIKGMPMIHCENPYQRELKKDSKGYKTTKNDENYHGYGLKSIHRIVEKYHGDVTFEDDNQIFKVNIIFESMD